MCWCPCSAVLCRPLPLLPQLWGFLGHTLRIKVSRAGPALRAHPNCSALRAEP
jgi:hypothetical protein